MTLLKAGTIVLLNLKMNLNFEKGGGEGGSPGGYPNPGNWLRVIIWLAELLVMEDDGRCYIFS